MVFTVFLPSVYNFSIKKVVEDEQGGEGGRVVVEKVLRDTTNCHCSVAYTSVYATEHKQKYAISDTA